MRRKELIRDLGRGVRDRDMDVFGLDDTEMEVRGVSLLIVITVLSLAPVTYIGYILTRYGLSNDITEIMITGVLLLVFVVIVLGVIMGLKWWNPGG